MTTAGGAGICVLSAHALPLPRPTIFFGLNNSLEHKRRVLISIITGSVVYNCLAARPEGGRRRRRRTRRGDEELE